MITRPDRRRLLGALLLAAAPAARARSTRVLHVMSYRADWQWNKDQLRGFTEALNLPGLELQVVALDAKRNDAAALAVAAREADALVASWKPDLIYTNDDVAQSAFAVHHLGSATPIVFSGVNEALSTYGFDRAANVTGVLEREHFRGTLNLLRGIKQMQQLRLAIVVDDDPTWVGVAARIREELATRSDVQVLHWLQPRTLDEYKARLLDLHGRVDAVGLLGVFRFRQAGGGFADYEQVLRWTAEHSRLPDFSFWDTRVERGTLCAVTVDGVEQGRTAGQLARRILVDGIAPARLTPQPSTRGRPMISLARARALGLEIRAEVLLNAVVVPRYAWSA